MASGGVERLRRRADYLRVQAAERRIALPGLLLQAAPGETGCCRVGFTASRKVGNAVTRNRARRRLKALAGEILPRHAISGHDYVLVARRDTPLRDYAALRRDLEAALKKLRLWSDQPSITSQAAGAT
jgi:ribonuclease P protein component